MSVGDDRGYQWFASIHGLPLPIWCEHSVFQPPADITLLFLPWHRAYLYYFELALQTRLGPSFTQRQPEDPTLADVGLPWWDWSSDESHTEGLPTAYSEPQVDGQPNPLFAASIATGNDPVFIGVWTNPLVQAVRNQIPGSVTEVDPLGTVRDPEPPEDLPQRGDIDEDGSVENILTAPTFEDFSSRLESGPHNEVHGWVGGSMSAVPTSAYDPIFWSHHAMIDRLWYIWQNSLYGHQAPPPHLMNLVLTPFPMTVADTLDISLLGYEYAVQANEVRVV